MTLFVFFAVLAAAAMHAIWNALVKVHLDRFLSITLMTLGMGAAALVVLPFVEVPNIAASSAARHTIAAPPISMALSMRLRSPASRRRISTPM